MDLEGSWQLVEWRRIAPDGTVSFPLGDNAEGLLVYTADGQMSVVMTGAERSPIEGGDPLGGSVEERAAAYSSCLAYTGTYERQGDTVVHRVAGSLYPNWSDTVQPRTIEQRDGQLVLVTPRQPGSPVNELAWQRAGTA